jgi:hypothetical protein
VLLVRLSPRPGPLATSAPSGTRDATGYKPVALAWMEIGAIRGSNVFTLAWSVQMRGPARWTPGGIPVSETTWRSKQLAGPVTPGPGAASTRYIGRCTRTLPGDAPQRAATQGSSLQRPRHLGHSSPAATAFEVASLGRGTSSSRSTGVEGSPCCIAATARPAIASGLA